MCVRFLYCIAIICAFRDVADAYKILGLFPHTGKSHQMVFEPLLKTLAERGHEVTVVSFFPLKNPPVNYTDVSLEGIAPIGLSVLDLNFMLNPLGPPFDSVTRALGVEGILNQILCMHPLAEIATNVCRKLVEMPTLKEVFRKKYDVLLVEQFNSDCMIGLAHAYGLHAPKIALLSNAMLPWSSKRLGVFDNPSYIPAMTTSYTNEMSFNEKLVNTFMYTFFEIWFRFAVQYKEQAIIENGLGRKIADLGELSLNTSAVFTNVFHSVHGVRLAVPGYVEVGGMHLRRKPQTLPHYIDKFLNESEHGVILFSWGSLIKTSTISPEKEEIIVRAFAKFPQRIIWKYEDSGPEGNLTGNLLRVNWIPQYELLQHPKVVAFLAHGGLLGMTEAIASGKPMVVVPFFGDQPHNAAFATKAGFATVLEYKDITEESLTRAFEKILRPEVRLKARRVSEMWRDRPMDPLDTAVYWVERVARWGHEDPLHLPGRNMPFYQRALLDVLAAVALTISTLLFVITLILKTAKRCMLSLFCNKKKQKFD